MSTRVVYKITGLDCPNCAKKVEKFLGAQRSIKKVNLNFQTKELEVFFKKECLNEKEIQNLITSIGFCVEVTE